nr:MAG TPA: hypothetical protein [Caudoviricetes sp.]
MKPLFYKVIASGMSYYFLPDEFEKALWFSNDFWLIQMVFIDADRGLQYRDYDRQRGEFVD